MKAGEIIDALERFFLDLIGQVIPGFCLLIGGILIWNQPINGTLISSIAWLEPAKWFVMAVLSFVVGHGVTSVGDILLVPGANLAAKCLRKIKLGKLVPRPIQSQTELFERIQQDSVFLTFKDEATKFLPSLCRSSKESIPVPSWRNVAMSIATVERNTVWRFMFISLLNQGIATVLLLLVVLQISLHGFAPFRIGAEPLMPLWLFCVLLILVSLPFLERRYVFYRIAMEIPFGMALVALKQIGARSDVAEFSSSTKGETGAVLTIYLAGGFQSGWQDQIKLAAQRFNYYDPRFHRLRDKNQYTTWDLEAIRRSDWVFAYLEASNPGGYALAVEIGYAKALGKRIILINEKRGADASERYFEMLSAASDVEVSSLSEGIEFLKTLETVV